MSCHAVVLVYLVRMLARLLEIYIYAVLQYTVARDHRKKRNGRPDGTAQLRTDVCTAVEPISKETEPVRCIVYYCPFFCRLALNS